MPSERKRKMLVVCPHPEDVAPGQRLKYEQYFDYFRQNGFDVDVRPFMTDRFQNIVYKKGHFIEKVFWTLYGYLKRFFLLFALPGYDVVYIFLWVTPFGPPVSEFLFCKLGKRIIYDIDDLVYLPASKSKANKLISGLKGKKKPIFLMRHAKHVITCTPYLDTFVKQFNSHTTDISSTINTSIYLPRTNYKIGKKVILGWSGSHSTSKYLHLLEPVFFALKEAGLPFKLLVMGDKDFHIEGLDIEAIAWDKSYEVETISRFDIGLYPLPDEEWVYGKSGLKALQYMAIGVPTVATAIGTNFRIIENEVTGFLASSNDAWFGYIMKIAGDENLRKQIGGAASEFVEKNFSVNANKDVYLSIIEKVAMDK